MWCNGPINAQFDLRWLLDQLFAYARNQVCIYVVWQCDAIEERRFCARSWYG